MKKLFTAAAVTVALFSSAASATAPCNKGVWKPLNNPDHPTGAWSLDEHGVHEYYNQAFDAGEAVANPTDHQKATYAMWAYAETKETPEDATPWLPAAGQVRSKAVAPAHYVYPQMWHLYRWQFGIVFELEKCSEKRVIFPPKKDDIINP